jgi:hypothetical protein
VLQPAGRAVLELYIQSGGKLYNGTADNA